MPEPMSETDLKSIEWQADHFAGTDYPGTSKMLLELLAEVRRLREAVNAGREKWTEALNREMAERQRAEKAEAQVQELEQDGRDHQEFLEQLEGLLNPKAHESGSIGVTLHSDINNLIQRAERAAVATARRCAEICETSEVLLPIESWETMRKVSAATAVELGAMIRREFKLDAAMKESENA